MPRKQQEMTDEDRKFFDGFVSTMTDDDYRRNRDSCISEALRAIEGPLQGLSQHRSIREPTAEDVRIGERLDAIRLTLKDLELSLAKPKHIAKPKKPRHPWKGRR